MRRKAEMTINYLFNLKRAMNRSLFLNSSHRKKSGFLGVFGFQYNLNDNVKEIADMVNQYSLIENSAAIKVFFI